MSASELPAELPTVADTVVVNYFLSVGEFALLATIAGGTIRVPRSVFDPDEDPDAPEETISELRRGLKLHERRSSDPTIPPELRRRSQNALPHFRDLDSLVAGGSLACETLSSQELKTYAELRDTATVKPHGVVAGLGRGEASALAIALNRTWTLATDDNDAIKVAQALRPSLAIRRIRGLLKEAVSGKVITLEQARNIHRSMLAAGFWDKGRL